MEKGKIKKERKYLSVILVPHSSDKVKVLKFSAVYPKLSALLGLILVFVVSIGIFITGTVRENFRLKQSVSTLSNLNAEQKNLLDEKASEISGLLEKEKSLNTNMADFVKKYQEMTDSYISNKTNRSGSGNDRSFITDINELKKLLDNIEKARDAEDKGSAELAETEDKLKKYMENIPTSWPASGRISSKFGSRNDPFFSREKFHSGIDIAADYGQPIKAAANGTVIYSGYYSGYGYAIIIDHGRGITTLYGHSSKLVAKKGQTVKKGDVVAKVGSSGRSTGSHLHFEVRLNDTPVDPLKYLSSDN